MPRLPLVFALALVTLGCGPGRFLEEEVGDEINDLEASGGSSSESSTSSESSETLPDPTTIDSGADWGPPISDLGGQGRGLTWLVIDSNAELGVVLIGVDEFSDPYTGDTPCTSELPIACLAKLNLPNPGVETDFYHAWTGGKLAITSPVAGTELSSREAADAICAEQHGPEYRMGEHHDPDGTTGWNWWAEADLAIVTPEAGRFWVAIDDQPGNCWD